MPAKRKREKYYIYYGKGTEYVNSVQIPVTYSSKIASIGRLKKHIMDNPDSIIIEMYIKCKEEYKRLEGLDRDIIIIKHNVIINTESDHKTQKMESIYRTMKYIEKVFNYKLSKEGLIHGIGI